jgi:hypothetical protein
MALIGQTMLASASAMEIGMRYIRSNMWHQVALHSFTQSATKNSMKESTHYL